MGMSLSPIQRPMRLMRLMGLKRLKLSKRSRRLLLPPNLPSPWWPCEVTTGQAKSAPKPLLVEMAAAMHAPVTAVHVLAETVVQVQGLGQGQADSVIGVATAWVTVVRVPISAKSVVRAWAMPPSGRNGKPWSVPKCLCANWPCKPMAKALDV